MTLRGAVDKLEWGLRVAGPLNTARGLLRYARVMITRPNSAEVHLRSGPVLEFDFPSQMPPVLLVFGDLIDPEFDFLRVVAASNWQVLDIGAAIGQFSMFAAMHLPDATVHAFEPSSSNVTTLRRNIARNRVGERVHVHRAALSDERGTMLFETAAKTWMSQLVISDRESGPCRGELIPVETLEATLEALRLEHVNVLKVNVAGFEPAVLRGALPSLAAGKIDILITLLGLASLPIYKDIADRGYRFFYYHPRRRQLYEVTRFDQDSVLGHRPWPARHIIGIRAGALDALIRNKVRISTSNSAAALAGSSGLVPSEAGT